MFFPHLLHDLEIERGRYIRPYIEPDKRMCKLCMQEAVTEEHFITKCHTYQDLRRDLYQNVIEIDNTFSYLSPTKKFDFLMTSTIDVIITDVMKFIFEALKTRSMKLSSIQISKLRQTKSK